MKKALVVIDMQNDFITGSLGNNECRAVVPEVINLINSGEYDSVVFTQDTHHDDYLQTQEGKKLPVVHCIENTEGWKVCNDILNAVEFSKHMITMFNIHKSTFGSLDLIDTLKYEFADYDEIHFCGVCTGICVISNVLIAKATLTETKICVVERACACVTLESHKTAIEAMKMCQVDII